MVKVQRNCKKCHVTKSIKEFSRNSRSKDGFMKTCKTCMSSIIKRTLAAARAAKLSKLSKKNLKVSEKLNIRERLANIYRDFANKGVEFKFARVEDGKLYLVYLITEVIDL